MPIPPPPPMPIPPLPPMPIPLPPPMLIPPPLPMPIPPPPPMPIPPPPPMPIPPPPPMPELPTVAVDFGYTPQSWKEDLKRSGGSDFLAHPLHAAVHLERADIVHRMLDEGYDRESMDGQGWTPLHYAAMKGDMAATSALLRAGDSTSGYIARRGYYGMPPIDLTYALRRADQRRRRGYRGRYTPRYFVHSVITGRSALDLAVEGGHLDIVKLMIAHKANLDTFSGVDGNTPLHLAAMGDKAEMVSVLCACLAAAGDHVDVVEAFISHGVRMGTRLSAVDIEGLTALHHASTSNSVRVIDVLIEAGAEVEAPLYGSRVTPLHLAASKGCLAAVSALLRHGAHVGSQTAQGATPLHYAAANAGRAGIADVVDLLLKQGADEEITNDMGQTPSDVVGSGVQEQNEREDVDRVRTLLANAPADRAWRRRGFLVMCRAHYPGDRVQLAQGDSHIHASVAHSKAEASEAEIEWVGVASMLMGVEVGGAADLVFGTIVGYL
eukprot:g11970.t1